MGKPRTPTAAGKLGGWLSIGVNGMLFLIKGAVALWSGSIAIAADAFHTLSDITTSLILLISIRISGKPGDRQHPFGHERAVHVATIVMSTLLAVTGVEVGRESIKHVFRPAPVQVSALIVVVLIGTIIIKEILARFSMRLAEDAHPWMPGTTARTPFLPEWCWCHFLLPGMGSPGWMAWWDW